MPVGEPDSERRKPPPQLGRKAVAADLIEEGEVLVVDHFINENANELLVVLYLVASFFGTGLRLDVQD